MIKKYILKKITVTTFCLILLLLFYLIPTHENIKIESLSNKRIEKENYVYLLDKDNYVSKVVTYFDSDNIEDEIKNRINILINGCSELNNFYPLIPKYVRLNKVKVDKNIVYLDFNEDFNNIDKSIETQIIESIVYTITEINGIDSIYITVNNKEYNSNIYKYPLNRNIGINKEYNLNSFNSINKTIIYFIKENDSNEYLVPITRVINSEEDKIEVIIKELKSSIYAQNNLNSYYNDNLKLIDYIIKDKKMTLIFNDSNNINDKVSYILSNSIFDNYDVNEIEISFKDNNNSISIKK